MSLISPEHYPYVPLEYSEALFGSHVVDRGRKYVWSEVDLDQWILTRTGAMGELVGHVQGTAKFPYLVNVHLQKIADSAREERTAASEIEQLVRRMAASRRPSAGPIEQEPPHPEEFQAFEAPDWMDDLAVWQPLQSRCSCPVAMNCKHGAALALYASRLAMAEAEETSIVRSLRTSNPAAPPAPRWQDILGPLLDDEPEGEPETPLALGFELFSEQLTPARFSWGNEELTQEHLDKHKRIFLAIRPLKRGKRNNWVKSGLSWRSFEFRVDGRGFDLAHADALTRIFALSESERNHTYGAVEQLWVNSFRSPLVWESLVRARDAGVALVGLGNVGEVRIGERAAIELDMRALSGSDGSAVQSAQEGSDSSEGAASAPVTSLSSSTSSTPTQNADVELRAVGLIDDVPIDDARMLGGSGLISVQPSAKAGVFDIVFAGADSPVPTRMQRLLETTDQIVIPAAERAAFEAEALPKLSRAARVSSMDRSVALPEPQGPSLLVECRYMGANTLEVSWLWYYPSLGRRFSVHTRAGSGRDLAFEDELLAEVRAFWPTAGGDDGAISTSRIPEGMERLTDVDTALFTSHVLPELEAMDDIEVHISGTRHEYRELDGAPHVKVTQTESTKNDWFDLGFTVTVDGRTIPFPSLFVALAKGQSKLLLEDRTYFSLDHPAFDALRVLIAEGEALAEWEPDRQEISKYQVGFWEDLADAADVAEAAEGWQATVGKLKNLDTIPCAQVPEGLAATLRPYQQEGFEYLALLHSLGLGGILADDMGLGKTLQTLALIQHAREMGPDGTRAHATLQPANDAPAALSGAVGTQAAVGTPTAAGPSSAADPVPASHLPFLVIAPSSVVGVWEAEAARFTPGLKVTVIDRTRKARGAWVSDLIEGADIVVTSYTIARIDSDEFAREQFAGLILDEAQFVKNRASRIHQSVKRIKAPFRLAITGTPMENSLADLWAIMSLVAPGVLGTHVQFRTQFTQPIESGEHPEKMEVLRRRVRPFMLRRTKELVAKDLPEKQEQVVKVELEAAHRKLYDRVLQRERKKVLGLLNDMDKNRFIVFRSLTLLRMLALDPAIVDDGEHKGVASSKLNAMFERLDEIVAEGHRVLVFSQFTSFLRRVAGELEERGVDYSYLDGSTRNRAVVIDEFREGDAPVFLISLKAGGFGLTLTEADYVFLLDPWWNPAAENQAIDRAHRIGQDKRVMVYRMVAEDTIEEKVLALQEKKQALFDALTDDGSAFSSSLSADDVRELFAPAAPGPLNFGGGPTGISG